MAPLHTLVLAAAVLLCLLSTALADSLNRTMCYCATAANELDSLVEAGAYYFFQYHSNHYNMDMAIDYTCRSAGMDNVCTMRWQQKQNRCRTTDGGWEFCYHQYGRKGDHYSFNGIKHKVGGLIVEYPKEEIASVCDDLCRKHVGLPRILHRWNIANHVGITLEWRGVSLMESFPDLPDIVLPHEGSPVNPGPSLDPGSIFLLLNMYQTQLTLKEQEEPFRGQAIEGG